MNLSYLARRRLRRIGIVLLALLVVAVFVWLCWVVWLERYVIYDREGASLNFELQEPTGIGQIAQPPYADGETVPIYYNEG